MQYFGKVTFGCTAQLQRGTGKCSQNGLGLMLFALFGKCTFSCTAELKYELESAPRMVWDQCFLHRFRKSTFSCTAELKRGTGKCSQNGLGPMLFAPFRKIHFRLHCGTERRNSKVLPVRSGPTAFRTILGRALPAALRN